MPLTVREIETLLLIAEAKTTKEIAAQMGISIKTVEHHRDHLYSKLGVDSAVGLVVHALLYGCSTCE
ncbi:MAG: response regulator transcription factor [Chthoniobacterales bacterium]